MSQPQFFARLAALLRALGDQEPQFGTFERNVVPTLVVGDASQVVPPLLAPQSLLGGELTGGATALTAPCVQFTPGAVGGTLIDLVVGMSVNDAAKWRVTDTPVALAAAFPLLPQVLIDNGARVTAQMGTCNKALFGNDVPTMRRAGSAAENPVVLPFSQTLEVVCMDDAATLFIWARVRDMEKNARLGEE